MSRYFFHIIDGKEDKDEEGTELGSLREARREAVKRFGSLLTEDPEQFWDGHDWRMEVTDEMGLTFLRIDFMTSESAAAHGL